MFAEKSRSFEQYQGKSLGIEQYHGKSLRPRKIERLHQFCQVNFDYKVSHSMRLEDW